MHVRASPDVKTGVEGITVFPIIQMVMDHHPWPGKGGRVYIEIAPSVYHKRVIVTQNHPNITLIGMGKSPAEVVITDSLNAKQAGGTFFTETVEINGAGFGHEVLRSNGPDFITAQSRTAPEQSTGFVILDSKVTSGIDAATGKHWIGLGRARRAYARAVDLIRSCRPT